jgi:hypothetical protein
VRIEGRLVGGGIAYWEGGWRFEGSIITGFLEVDGTFPAITNHQRTIRAKGAVTIPIRSLRY